MHAGFASFYLRQILPDLVGGESKDGRDQAHQRFGDAPQNGLRGAAFRALWRKRVEAVFEDVEVEGAQLNDAELVDGVVDAVELEVSVPSALSVGSADFFDQLAAAGEHVAIERQQAGVG